MSAPIELPDAIVREAMPDDDIVVAYVMRGALAKYVEGVAAKNAAFREELEAAIDGMEEAGETVSDAARAWRRPGARVLVFPVKPARGFAIPWPALSAAAAVLLVIGGAAYMREKNESARVQALKDQEIAAKNAELEKIIAELKAQQEEMALAQSELASAKTDSERAEAAAKLAVAQEQQRKTQAAIEATRAIARPPKAAGAKPACACDPKDPLCGCVH